MPFSEIRRAGHTLARPAFALALGLLAGTAGTTTARAQAIVLSVNGDPITSVDIEQRMKLLRALKRPASRDAAIESMVMTRIKQREASRFGVSIKDEETPEEIQVLAKKMKVSANQIASDISRAGVSQAAATGFLKAELAYSVLIRSLNRGVDASEIAVRREMAKEKGKGGITSYVIRQVVFTLSPGDGAAALQASAKQAEALRARFTNCESGIPYAKTLPGVAVRERMTRNSTQLNEGIKEVLDKTPVGHLTTPTRSPNGIELIAVCDRSASKDDDVLRKEISDRLLAEHYAEEEQAKYKELRAHAVIERR